MALNKAKAIVSSCPVVVFSKTYCGYCRRVKQLLTQLGASYKAIELGEEREGEEIQSALTAWTGQRTVPNVFIGGKHIGGCESGSYREAPTRSAGALLADVGLIANNSAQL
ncbi:hypothetical protein WN943_027614 [Citrus x changshan-huyou]